MMSVPPSSNSGESKVETISRLAQWRMEGFSSCSYRRSEPFKIGIWTWFLSVEKNKYLYLRLFPEMNRITQDQPPIAKFIFRVSSVGPGRHPYTSPVHERRLRKSDDFAWPIDYNFHGRLIVDVEFLDLKIDSDDGREHVSIWPIDVGLQALSTRTSLRCLSRMFEDNIHCDVTIITADGTIKAHKAVLSACSPVFNSMFLHDLKEKESSTIEIADMSLESCMALFSYIYGNIKQEEFWKHRNVLLGAANKYDIADLKESCEKSMLEDINSGNVLERLQDAWLYQLNNLKKGCLTYLFDFGRIYDVKDEIATFFRQADRELLLHVFQELMVVWKPYAL